MPFLLNAPMNQEQISESAIWGLDKLNHCKWLEEEGGNWKSNKKPTDRPQLPDDTDVAMMEQRL